MENETIDRLRVEREEVKQRIQDPDIDIRRKEKERLSLLDREIDALLRERLEQRNYVRERSPVYTISQVGGDPHSELLQRKEATDHILGQKLQAMGMLFMDIMKDQMGVNDGQR